MTNMMLISSSLSDLSVYLTLSHAKINYRILMTEREPNHHRFEKDNRKRILVVDDEYDINLTIKIVLEQNGFIVDSFNGASQALANFMTGMYDLVILDLKMPEMDGFSLFEKIKKLDDRVAICFLTAADYAYYEISKKKHPTINENCVIHKPVDNESLLRQIKSILLR